MQRLVVIAGPANSGKYPLAQKLCAADPSLLLVHRDTIRSGLVNKTNEGQITHLMGVMAEKLLGWGYSVCACAWNLEHSDHIMWDEVAAQSGVKLEWIDVRDLEEERPPT